MAITAPSSPPPEPETSTPLPRPIARGAGHPYPGPGGRGRAGGLGRCAAFGRRNVTPAQKRTFAKMENPSNTSAKAHQGEGVIFGKSRPYKDQ